LPTFSLRHRHEPRWSALLGLLAGGLVALYLSTLPLGEGSGYIQGVWAFDPERQPGAAALGMVGAALLWVLLTGLWAARRGAWWAWLAPLAAPMGLSLAVRLQRALGDPWDFLIEYTEATPSEGWLFVGGELGGHLWYVLAGWLSPLEGEDTVFWAARMSGWLGLLGLMTVARAMSRGADPVRRALLLALLLISPTTVLFLGYPQSTGLLLALTPFYAALGLQAAESAKGGWRWPVAGALLALCCASHGAAYFLGLSALTLAVLGCVGGTRRRCGSFVAGFALTWLPLAALELHLSRHARGRGQPWAFLHPDFEWAGLLDQIGGPVGVLGPSGYFETPWHIELWCWLWSTIPGVTLTLPVALLALLLMRRNPGAPAAFLAAASVGTGILWASWESWYRYPGDWDVTAIAALSLLFLGGALLMRLPERVSAFLLAMGLLPSAWIGLHLALRFV
jgi:hypothetical protein